MENKFERTEQQKVTMAPVKVLLGEKEYDVRPLRITPAQEWRETFMKQVADISGVLKQDANTSPVFIQGLAFVFLQFPQKMVELIFSYAPYLPREEVLHRETGATEEQISLAFGQIVQLAFPFTGELAMVTKIMSMAANFPASVKSTSVH